MSAVTMPARRRLLRRRRTLRALRLLGALVVAVIILFPLYWMVVVALSSRAELLGRDLRLWPAELTLDNITRVLDAFPVGAWSINSISIALVTSVLTVAMNLLAGFAFAHLRFRGSTTVLMVCLATMMLPVQVIMVSLFRLVTGLGLYGSYWAVILPASASAFGILLARQFMLSIPTEVLEAARLDGSGLASTLLRIVLPLSKPLIAVLFFMTLLQSWNDFAWPLIALRDNALFTLPIGLLFLQGQFGADYGGTMAFALMNVLPIAVVFLLAQRWFVQGFARTGLR